MARLQAWRPRWPPVLSALPPAWETRLVSACWRWLAVPVWPPVPAQLRFAGLPLARAASAQALRWALPALPR
jgi:hypothetical protein